jgi:hypothetical protein
MQNLSGTGITNVSGTTYKFGCYSGQYRYSQITGTMNSGTARVDCIRKIRLFSLAVQRACWFPLAEEGGERRSGESEQTLGDNVNVLE